MLSLPDEHGPSLQDSTPTRVWTRRLLILLTVLAAFAVLAIIFMIASRITVALLIFAVAALLAYAIEPVVNLFHRIMPRPLAILFVYLIVFFLFAVLFYFIITTMVVQLTGLAQNATALLKPSSNGANSPLVNILLRVGLPKSQIDTFASQLGSQLTNIAGSIAGGVVPILSSVANGALNVLLTIVISVYLLVDGARALKWLRKGPPISQRGWIDSLLTTVQQVVGSYVRGQISLCLIIGTIVGAGTALLGLPQYAVLLGVISFVTEFIPVLGTIVCGTIAVLLALTQGWLTAVLILAFFVVVHIFEGYVLAPRLIGKALGLQPVVSLLALTIGAELFGPWGTIFASPLAGLLQALTVAFWTNYRKTHSEEFPSDGQALASKQKEKQVTTTTKETPSDDKSHVQLADSESLT